MRITIELPNELVAQAKTSAALSGISFRQFLIEAITRTLAPEKRRLRKTSPAVGHPDAPLIKAPTRQQIDEALFGSPSV
jgi:hypothetical protein